MSRIAGDRLIELSSVLLDLSMDQGNIGLEDFSCPKLIGEIFVRAFSLGDHHQAGGVLIEAVNNAWPRLATDSRELLKMKRKGVCQSAGGDTGGRVNDHAGWFIDHRSEEHTPELQSHSFI